MKEAQTRFFPEPMVYDQESKQKVSTLGFSFLEMKIVLYFQPMKYITLVNQSPEHDGEGNISYF